MKRSASAKHTTRALTKRLWGYLVPYRLLLWASLVVILLTSVGALVRPLIMRSAIDGVVKDGDRVALFHGGLLLAGVLVAEQLLGLVQNVRRAGRWRAGGRGPAARGVRVLAATAARFLRQTVGRGGSYRASPMTRTRSWRCSRPER
ncbi:MAG: hypothetical protein WDO74_34340 [Pseudomonadota bacterium]